MANNLWKILLQIINLVDIEEILICFFLAVAHNTKGRGKRCNIVRNIACNYCSCCVTNTAKVKSKSTSYCV